MNSQGLVLYALGKRGKKQRTGIPTLTPIPRMSWPREQGSKGESRQGKEKPGVPWIISYKAKILSIRDEAAWPNAKYEFNLGYGGRFFLSFKDIPREVWQIWRWTRMLVNTMELLLIIMVWGGVLPRRCTLNHLGAKYQEVWNLLSSDVVKILCRCTRTYIPPVHGNRKCKYSPHPPQKRNYWKGRCWSVAGGQRGREDNAQSIRQLWN